MTSADFQAYHAKGAKPVESKPRTASQRPATNKVQSVLPEGTCSKPCKLFEELVQGLPLTEYEYCEFDEGVFKARHRNGLEFTISVKK